jgi:hypothetical protein
MKERQKMNARYRRVAARFAPETRFEVRPAPPAPFRATQETELELLKNRLLLERLDNAGVPDLNVRLRRAANEAAALAWTTQFPLLLFPALFDEKARTARLELNRQTSIRDRSQQLLAA